MSLNQKINDLTASVFGSIAETPAVSEQTSGRLPSMFKVMRDNGIKAASMVALAATLTLGAVGGAQAQQTVPVVDDYGRVVAYKTVGNNRVNQQSYDTNVLGTVGGALGGGWLGSRVSSDPRTRAATTATGAVLGAGLMGGGKPVNYGGVSGAVVGGGLGYLIGDLFGPKGRIITTAGMALVGASLGNDYVHDERVKEARKAEEARQAAELENKARLQQGMYIGPNIKYNGPIGLAPTGKFSSCMAQFMGNPGEGRSFGADVRTNPVVKSTLDRAYQQMVEKRRQLDEALTNEDSARAFSDMAVSSDEQQMAERKKLDASRKAYDAKREFVAVGMDTFFSKCDMAVVKYGLDVSSYAHALELMDAPIRTADNRGNLEKMKDALVEPTPEIAATYSPKNRARM